MSSHIKGLAIAAAIVVAAGAGVWAGQNGLLHLPWGTHSTMKQDTEPTQPSGPVIYYRDPDKRPFYSLGPRETDDGRDYIAVLTSEDVSFDKPQAGQEAATEAGRTIKYYRNPMGLPDTSPVPKKDSMGMDYIAVYEGEDSDDGSVKVSLGKLQRTGVETALVGKHAITRTIKAPGTVQLDERRVAVVAPRYDGYVVRIGTATTGTHVNKGDELVTMFGQELLNWGARLIVEQPAGGGRKFDDAGVVIGASRRLDNLGAPAEFVEEILRTRRVPDTVTIRAPIDGIVLERNFVDGQAFKAGDVLFRIADHSSVWLMADVAESDIDAIKPGQAVAVTTRARPGRTFSGTVTVVYPHLMKETRTARVRIELPNPDFAFLPDMYGDVEIASGGSDLVVAVPASAVIDSGRRKVVLIERGDGRFEPGEIKTGRRGDEYVEVTNGIAEGDRVVVNGNFLIDAESNLQAALKAFNEPKPAESKP